MQKWELLKRCYEAQNRFNKITNQEVKPIPSVTDLLEEAKEFKKQELIDREASLNAMADNAEEAIKKAIEGYYSSEAGSKQKKEWEQAIEKEIQNWRNFEKKTMESLTELLKDGLGKHWAVARFDSAFVEIGILDPKKTTPTHKEFIFGQTVEIRYEEKHWSDHKERFEMSVGSCGKTNLETGITVGERSAFYIGIGKLLEHPALQKEIKAALLNSQNYHDKVYKELESLRRLIANPLVTLQ